MRRRVKFVGLRQYPHYGKAATDVLTGETGDSATTRLNEKVVRKPAPKSEGKKDERDGTTVTDDGCDGGIELGKAFANLEVGRVEVLRAVGQEVETGHQ